MGFLRQEYWSGLPFHSSVGHILSELSTRTHHPEWPCKTWLITSLSYTRLWSTWSFLLTFCDCGFSVENSQRHGNTRPPYLCQVRNLYEGQEATVRTRHGSVDWFKIGKRVRQSCVLSSCLFNLYAEHIMWKARLDESQTGIKIARRNINNLRHADDTTIMAESEEEPKSLLMKVKASEKVGLNSAFKKLRLWHQVQSLLGK